MFSRWAVAALLSLLLSACGTTRVVRLETGEGAPLVHRPLTPNRSMQVNADLFQEALTRLVLEAPLPLRPSQASWLVRTSSSSVTARPQENILKGVW